jgi:hypothetical protein
MSAFFHLIDLVSQADAVERHLSTLSAAEKLEWLSTAGKIEARPKEYPFEEQSYFFESATGTTCCFFFKNDHFVFIGDHTTFTAKKSREENA